MQAPRPFSSAPALRRLACAIGLGASLVAPVAAQGSAPASTAGAVSTASEAAEIQRLIRDGQHAQALKLIDDALAKNPKDPQMRFRRGVALSMLDRKTEALAVFQKLVEDQPDMPAPYNNMAVIYGAQGEYEKARSALERAIRTNPAYATAYQNLGDVYAQLASQAYSKALQLDKSDPSVPPKLALLRELTSGPIAAAPAAVATTTKRDPASTVVAAAPSPAPPPPAAASKPPVVASPPPAATPPKPVPTAATPPAVVASPAPPPPAAAAKPAPAPAGNQAGEVEAAVKSWASAWSKRDMAGYYAAYTPEFSGQSGSRKTWEQDRRDRIAPRKQITVEVSDLQVSVNGERATARFRQSYASDSMSVVSRKTLQLARGANGKWLIRQESAGS
ncbi:MAG TPA: tetratricopeptide repeat protein [Ideonella sp.]|nr:tetratricopeptide repeat protein [Ideonella sp.]